MQFKQNFVIFVLAAVLSSVSAIPLPGSDIVSGTDSAFSKGVTDAAFDLPFRGRSPFPVLARDPRHGSGSRGRGDSKGRRGELEARRHGSGSRGRGDSRTRRSELEARRHGSGSRGRGDSQGRRSEVSTGSFSLSFALTNAVI
ncbi:hypothetical protein FKP32DRAFT_1680185 [Trametes sanguinea]|nr:hypothetical protein FKP32DRAFT_1680185 [Trametes sanguinea]